MRMKIKMTNMCLFAGLACAGFLMAQGFDSGSNGTHGDLIMATPGEFTFDPADFPAAIDNVYHFGDIQIGAGVKLRLGAAQLGSQAVVWLASGDVVIDGNLDLNGKDGHDAGQANTFSEAGAGGFSGGRGGTSITSATAGLGPGGGFSPSSTGRDGGHVTPGGGRTYGNRYLKPLIGGSGGSGGIHHPSGPGSGGGAGGGVLLIASSQKITLNGMIEAKGGVGGQQIIYRGGAGSGGAIRLIAPMLEGSGSLNVERGMANASHGRIRLEAFEHNFSGTLTGNVAFASPSSIFPPSSSPRLNVVSVNGVNVPDDPMGSFDPVDVVIDAAGDVDIVVEAANIPVGTPVTLTLFPEDGDPIEILTSGLSGTFDSSTATGTATIPHGFSKLNILATWDP